ncbi:hypothetical protein DIJ64_09575 [Mycobacterium leprae]|uniref:Uncharacterized protein n=1 Tax=Mycobacterium leprae TaxID=1769 RepID=A0AAD0KUJ6_MYCLR|nr:hypothetical protein DIJ64_09575 [Mycobacterium leprae]OAR20851.1 hypothetical protein A8144_09235 [Mycobacterium leprae 3125609]OAX70958.1 hypothetical protein A3216_08695 [Mycobacterium leprae 7935681]
MPFIGVFATNTLKQLPADMAAAGESRFHLRLAQLAGNALPAWRDVVAVEHVKQRIVEAISDGDDSLARYRIHRHLYAAASWWL